MTPGWRAGAVFAALAILYWRIPDYITHPQFWAEDGMIWKDAYMNWPASVATSLAGYSNLAARLIGLLAPPFPVVWAPLLYGYAALAATLWTVWFLTSPRLDLPYPALGALAVVCVYQGGAVLGTAANIQWLVPIAAFGMLFMRPSCNTLIAAMENAFLFIAGLTGPYSIFLAPLFVMAAWRERLEVAETRIRRVGHAIIMSACEDTYRAQWLVYRRPGARSMSVINFPKMKSTEFRSTQ